MPLPKIDDARKLSDQELADEILAAKRELFQLRMQQATRRLEKPHQFKHTRHRIAQMMTVLQERKVAAEAATKAVSAEVKESSDQPPVTEAAAKAPLPETQESASQSPVLEATPESTQSEAQEEE